MTMRYIKQNMKLILASLSLILAFSTTASDNPLVQGLKIQNAINGTMQALSMRGVKCTDVEDMSNAVWKVALDDAFITGVYEGDIRIGAKKFNTHAFSNVSGRYNVLAPYLLETIGS